MAYFTVLRLFVPCLDYAVWRAGCLKLYSVKIIKKRLFIHLRISAHHTENVTNRWYPDFQEQQPARNICIYIYYIIPHTGWYKRCGPIIDIQYGSASLQMKAQSADRTGGFVEKPFAAPSPPPPPPFYLFVHFIFVWPPRACIPIYCLCTLLQTVLILTYYSIV